MKAILTLSLLLITVLFYAHAGTVDQTTEKRKTADFFGIIVNSGANIIITQGQSSDVQISGDPNSISKVTTEVINGSLIIDGPIERKTDIYITVEDLNLIELNGSARIFGNGTLNSDMLVLKVNGSGSIKMDIRSITTGMIVKGSGKIVVSGTTGSGYVKVSGSGRVFATYLDALTPVTFARETGSKPLDKRPKLKIQ